MYTRPHRHWWSFYRVKIIKRFIYLSHFVFVNLTAPYLFVFIFLNSQTYIDLPEGNNFWIVMTIAPPNTFENKVITANTTPDVPYKEKLNILMNKINKNRKTMFKISCREMKFDLFWCLSFISNYYLRFRHDLTWDQAQFKRLSYILSNGYR